MKRLLLSLIAAFLLSLQLTAGASPVAVRLYPSGFIMREETEVLVTAIIEPDKTNRQLDLFLTGGTDQHSTIDLTANQGRKVFSNRYRIGSGRYVAEAVLVRLIDGKYQEFRAVSQGSLTVCGIFYSCGGDGKVRKE